MAKKKRRLRLGVPDPGNRRAPPIWNPDLWTATKGTAKVTWLPDHEFDVAARKVGIDPEEKDGFALFKRWWAKDEIVLRARCLGLFPHEVRHIEEGHFHD